MHQLIKSKVIDQRPKELGKSHYGINYYLYLPVTLEGVGGS